MSVDTQPSPGLGKALLESSAQMCLRVFFFIILLGVVPWHMHHAQTGTSSCLFASFHLTTVFLSDFLQCPRGFCTTVSHEAVVD